MFQTETRTGVKALWQVLEPVRNIEGTEVGETKEGAEVQEVVGGRGQTSQDHAGPCGLQ